MTVVAMAIPVTLPVLRERLSKADTTPALLSPDEMIIELPVSIEVGSGCGDDGDLNGDGDVSILDIISMINCILDEECLDCSDLNDDNLVNIQDIITLINII